MSLSSSDIESKIKELHFDTELHDSDSSSSSNITEEADGGNESFN